MTTGQAELVKPARARPGRLRGRHFLLATGVLSAVCLVAAVVGSRFIQSPAQIAAETAPPPFTVLTEPVTTARLLSAVTTAGTVEAARMQRVASLDAAVTDGRSVLTKIIARKGEAVRSGTVLFEAAASPVFALPGSTPSFRNLQLGVSGPDVAQLQKALRALGYSTGSDLTGDFGRGTSEAVRQFYLAKGYPPVEAVPVGEPADAQKGTKAPDPGYQLPMSAAVYLKDLPARVDAVLARVGEPTGGDVLAVSSGRPVVRATLDEQSSEKVTAGDKAEVYLPGEDPPRRATVKNVSVNLGEQAGSDAPPTFTATLDVKGHLPTGLVGQSVRVRIVKDAMTRPGLVVPVAALSSDATGATFVTVVDPGGQQRTVAVRVGFIADGQVEVVPSGGALKEGDAVRLGVSPVGADSAEESGASG